MAQAQYDKFIELRKNGVDAKTARTQAYGEIPKNPTPTNETTPVVPPTPLSSLPEARTGDVVVGVGGEKFIQANNKDFSTNVSGQGQVVNQSGQDLTQLEQVRAESFGRREGANITPIAPKETTTPTSTTTTATPTPVNTTAPTEAKTPKTEVDPVANQAIEDAKNGVYRAPEFYDKLRKGENPIKQDSGTIFNTLRAGGNAPTSDTPEYRQAQARYNTFKRFSTYDVASLSTAMQDGSLLMGTQAYNDVISDPAMLARIQRAKAFTSGSVDMAVIGEKSGQYVMTSNPTVAKALEDGNMSQEEYNSLTNNPSVEAQAKVVSEARTKYDEYKRQLEAISDTVDEEYKGANDIFRNAVKSNLDKSIRRLFNSASDDLQNALGTYTELKNSSTQLLELNMKQYEKGQAEQSQLAQEARQQQYAQENAVFQSNLGLQTKQAEFEQSLAQQAQLAKDPISGTNAIIDTFEKMGIMADRSRQEIIADVQAKVASGIPLGQALSELQTGFKSKPQYQKSLDLQMGQLSDAQKLKASQDFSISSDIRNFAQQKELAIFNKDMDRQDFLFQLENDPAKRLAMAELEQKLNSNKSLFDVLGKNVGTYEGNRGYDLAGKLGDPMPAGGNWKVDSIIDANYQSSPYGNSVVMVDENGNKIRYSHLDSIGVKPGDQLSFGDIVGTRGNTGNVKGANGEKLTAEQLKAGRGAHLDVEIKDSKGNLLSNEQQAEWLKSKKAGAEGGYTEPDINIYNSMSPTDKKKSQNDPGYRAFLSDYSKVMKDKNAPLEDILKYSAGQNKMGDAESKSLDKFSQALGQISEIQKQISKMKTGPILGRLRSINPYDTDAQVLKAELQALIPNLARGVYGEVGVLTDNDIAIYAKTIPNLKSTEDINNAILAMTLQTMGTGYKSQLQSLASAKNDVSGYGGIYNQYMDIVNQLKSTNTSQPANNQFESDWNDL